MDDITDDDVFAVLTLMGLSVALGGMLAIATAAGLHYVGNAGFLASAAGGLVAAALGTVTYPAATYTLAVARYDPDADAAECDSA